MSLTKEIFKEQLGINQDVFLMLLKGLKFEQAMDTYINKDVQIDYNDKERSISKKAWARYLKKTILNKFTQILQFEIEKDELENNEMMYKINMICKKLNGTIHFTEILLVNNWNNNHINRMQYKLINH